MRLAQICRKEEPLWQCGAMPSVSEFRSEYDLPESLRELVRPIDDTTDLGGALRVAGDGAVALAQGSAAAGLVVARKGVEVSKELAARARRAREEASPLIKAATEKALVDKRRREDHLDATGSTESAVHHRCPRRRRPRRCRLLPQSSPVFPARGAGAAAVAAGRHRQRAHRQLIHEGRTGHILADRAMAKL